MPEETEAERIARLKRKHLGKITSPAGAAKRKKMLLGGVAQPARGPFLLGADDPRRKVSWRAY